MTNNNDARHQEFIDVFFNLQLKNLSAFNDISINIIIKFKHFDFKIFIDDSKKKIERLNLKFNEYLTKVIDKFFVNDDHYEIFFQ